MTTLTPDEIAKKALYMQRDYTMSEIAALLNIRLEDLNAIIENYKKPKAEIEVKTEKPKKQTKRR